MTRQKSIIVASAHLADGPLKLGSSHLARCFAEAGYRTLYLNAPTSLLHWLNPSSRAAATQRWRALRLQSTATPNLSELTPLTYLPHHNSPLLRSAPTLWHWPDFTLPRIANSLADAGFDDADAIVFDSVMFWPLAKKLKLASVYRIADAIGGFAVNTPAMIALHREVLCDADFVFYTADHLAPGADERRGPSRMISNGVYASRFEAPQPVPEEYKNLRRPIVVYAGAIEDWFDADGLRQAAHRFPNAVFIIIGPNGDRIKDRTACTNVHVLGSRPHGQLPAYLQHADIGIIPFDLTRSGPMLDGVCPLKLFEYLASGIDVVSFGGAGVKALHAPAHLYDPRPGSSAAHASFVDALGAALAGISASPPFVEARRIFARKADWKARLQELELAMRAAGIAI